MARKLCHHCQRLQVNCLCASVTKIDNWVEIVILQHPLEVNQVKGTAKLTQLCLQKANLQVGESFEVSDLAFLQDGKVSYLLYPNTDDFRGEVLAATTLSQDSSDLITTLQQIRVVVLDGTWKKTRKMLFLNSELSALPRIQIQPTETSRYEIRKQKNAQSLSTLEAIQQLLVELERDKDKYAPLTSVFQALIQQQKAFREGG